MQMELVIKFHRETSYCDVLQVILKPICRVFVYPRQIIKVDAA
jgi:hypothetical protein